MTIDTQNHIRDSLTIACGAFATTTAWADYIGALSFISPTLASKAPLFLGLVPLIHAAMGMAIRQYNIWYPPQAPKPLSQ